MPIRLLLYAAEEYKLFIANHARNLYRSTLTPLPTPNFYCFYDGRKEMPPKKILLLSDAFGEDISALELQVRMISLKAGQNEELKESCPPLKEYSLFSNYLNLQLDAGLSHDEAVRRTLAYCQQNGIMQDYLKQRKKEVFDMLNFAYNEEDARLAFIEEGTEIGIQQGIQQGVQQGIQQERMQQLSQYTSQALAMLKDGLSIDNVARYSPLPLENIKSIAKKNGLL